MNLNPGYRLPLAGKADIDAIRDEKFGRLVINKIFCCYYYDCVQRIICIIASLSTVL